MKRVGVVIFPGTNCDQEAIRVFDQSEQFSVTDLWYDDPLPGNLDLVILPGGWSYGDTLRAGAIARFSKIMPGVIDHANRGGLVMGICNGFQILTESGLLPGALARNSSLRFRCEVVHCRIESAKTPFFNGLVAGSVVPLPIAHGEGRFVADTVTLKQLEDDGLIALRYCTTTGETSNSANPNGSINNIAGIVSRNGNVFGLMPHPERLANELVNGLAGYPLMTAWASA